MRLLQPARRAGPQMRAVTHAVLDSILNLLHDWALTGIVLRIAVVIAEECTAWTGGGG